VIVAFAISSPVAHAQTTEITTEYLMTLYAPLDPPQQIDGSLLIYNVREGGWVRGPKINGTVLAPAADWLRVMPDCSMRLDVRATFQTDDGALVYTSYNGVISSSEENAARLANGEILTSEDLYFVIAPTLRTSSETYAWLNHVQCIGKIVEIRGGDNPFVKYDIFVVR
jgi:hypothetical protein